MSDSSLSDQPIDTCPRCSAPLVAGMVICPDCEIPLADLSSASTGPLDPRGQLPATLESGQSLGDRYTIVERVGAGGMGLIYKAFDRRLGRSVALKMIQAGVAERPGARERFKREILLAQQVSHPNVCRVHDLGEFQGQPFISMEYVEGQTLETLVQSMGHLSPTQTVSLAKQICAGLAAIHQRGIVHRDLKPANVMVDRLGHVVLMDFGMAYHEDQERLTQAGAVFGTLGYLSPEQVRGRVEPRSDLYALGLILYEMLTGRRPPGDGDALPLALRERGEPCPPPSHFSPEVPGALDQLVMRCLEREPDKRYASAEALGAVLQQFEGPLTRSGVLTREVPQPAPPRAWATWRTLGGVLLAGMALAVAARWRAPAAPPAARAVAFLPLAYSGPAEESYLKDLLPLVLSRELQGSTGLDVTPFSVSRTFGPQEDPRSVARQLGVALVVTGSASSAPGEAARVVELRALRADGRVGWTGRYAGTAATLLGQAASMAGELARASGWLPPPAARPRSAEALRHYLEGVSLLEGWDVPRSDARAVAAFQAALQAAPEAAEAHAGLARAYLRRFSEGGDAAAVTSAEGAAAQAVRLAPEYPEGHLAMGLVLLARGRSAEAGVELEKTRRLAPGDDTACVQMAGAYARLGRLDEAQRLYDEALALRPNYWGNHNELGAFLVQKGDLQGAEAAFRRVIALRPESDSGYGNLGATLILAGRFAEAEPLLLAGARIRPDAATYNNLGFTYYASGRYQEALEAWEKAKGYGTGQVEYYNNTGDALRQLGNAARAAENYGMAARLARERLAVNPHDHEARAALVLALSGSGRCPQARAERGAIEREADSSPQLAYYLAVASAVCRDRRGAERFVELAVRGGAPADAGTNPDLRAAIDSARLQALLAGAGAAPGRPAPRR